MVYLLSFKVFSLLGLLLSTWFMVVCGLGVWVYLLSIKSSLIRPFLGPFFTSSFRYVYLLSVKIFSLLGLLLDPFSLHLPLGTKVFSLLGFLLDPYLYVFL
ncbi:hypothetical protein RhiirA1_393074 [Rhizophagus irregularis]|uniref:Uncharacterized protein n=1 Tax=Rhizophagus irregularis TaxID=588596 RepID=A0A2I1EN53_9GLOM|nr:hypothetical protein RhiirA1_393074 [Rhizophagus irregularis]PKY23553.1 hypothetical protein RhiirB3_387313 [Rhizophagus irregularis]